MKKIVFILSLLFTSIFAETNSTKVEGYYYKGDFVNLHVIKDSNLTRKDILRYKDDKNQTISISNKLLVKFHNKPDIKKVESDYNISHVKTMRKIYLFEVENINNVLKIAKDIYEKEDVKYAQPSFIKKVKNSAIQSDSIENHHIQMHAKELLSDAEDTKSMKDDEGSVNYYKYYDDVFRYADESYWQIHNKGGFEATAYHEGAFTNIISVADVDSNVIEAIDAGYTGKGIRVAVIDSSFELNHPDLRFSDSFNINKKNKDISPDTTADFHGTAVAGVIAANRNNNYGIMGIAPDAYLIGFNGLFEIEDTEYFSQSYIEMFYRILDENIDIVNCSWQTMDVLDEALEDVLEEVATDGRNGKGTFLIFSTGNEGYMKLTNESALPFVVSVGSIEANGKRSGFSSYGKKIDLVAPSNFVSLDLVGKNGFEEEEKGFVTGTSFSAPVVAGCIALILEVNPNLTRGEVLDIIYSTTKKVGEGNYSDGSFSYEYSLGLDEDDAYNQKYTKNSETGYGLIDVNASIEKAKSYIKTDKEKITRAVAIKKDQIEALKNGWTVMMNAEAVEEVHVLDDAQIAWIYQDDVWLGYSSNEAFREELEEKGILFEKIAKNSAIWIYK